MTATGGAAGLLTTEAGADGGTVTYTFTAGSPGTYLYESGSDVAKQVEMGLYGALIVRPDAGADFAYDDARRSSTRAASTCCCSARSTPTCTTRSRPAPRYDFNDAAQPLLRDQRARVPRHDPGQRLVAAAQPAVRRAGPHPAERRRRNPQPALIRMLNAGARQPSVPPARQPHARRSRRTAGCCSARRRSASTEHFGETIGSGQTQDYLLRWDDQDQLEPGHQPAARSPQPNYRNVTFKDANTWYSGSPYLGYKGTLPTGTTRRTSAASGTSRCTATR